MAPALPTGRVLSFAAPHPPAGGKGDKGMVRTDKPVGVLCSEVCMSKYQVTWARLMKDVERGNLSVNRIGSLYDALTDANRVVESARKMEGCRTQGDIAYVMEESGDTPDRSSDSWYEEMAEWEKKLCEALERLEVANDKGYNGYPRIS